MNDNTAATLAAEGLLDLDAAGFTILPQQEKSRLADILSDNDADGVAMLAPKEVNFLEAEELPAVLLCRRTAMREWEVVWEDSACLLAVDHGREGSRAGPAFRPPGMDSPVPPPDTGPRQKPDENARTWFTAVRRRDLRQWLDIPWRSGTWTCRAVYFDWLSNPATTRLDSGAVPEPPLPYEREEALLMLHRLAEQGGSLGRPLEQGGAGEEGVWLEGPGAPSPDADALRLRLAVLAPIRDADVVEPQARGDDTAFPRAFVPASLVVVKRNASHPMVLDLRLPVYQAVEPGAPATASLVLDLAGHLPPGARQGEFRLYLLHRSLASDALAMDFQPAP